MDEVRWYVLGTIVYLLLGLIVTTGMVIWRRRGYRDAEDDNDDDQGYGVIVMIWPAIVIFGATYGVLVAFGWIVRRLVRLAS